jgi:hypothetical protein
LNPNKEKMVASSSIGKSKGIEVSKIQLVKSDACPPTKFCVIPKITMKSDSMGVLSSIPTKVIRIHNVQSCYIYKIGVGNYEIWGAYEKLCDEGVLKEEFKIVEKKGLTRTLEFLGNFKIEWIKVVLSWIHDMKFWLYNEPIKITKKMIHKVTGYPTLDKKKMMRHLSQEEVE